MSAQIRQQARDRGITRLCHFTQSRNLPHILDAGFVLSTAALEDREMPINRNDPERIDSHEDYVCCSVEYPNAWFMSQAGVKEPLFRDWVVLTIDPRFLWDPTTRFSPVNAATGGGRHIAGGPAAFEQMFDLSPPGSRFPRSMFHLEACPTDNQAEVLVRTPISTDAITSLVFETADAAAAEHVRLEQLGKTATDMHFVVCPAFFKPRDLASLIRTGERPSERHWSPPVGSTACLVE